VAVLRCKAVHKVLHGFCWTEWVNHYKASEGLDLEIFTRIAALQHGVCLKPIAVDYARVDGKPVNESIQCNLFGCSCKDEDQMPGVSCSDYKVRFLCQCKHNKVTDSSSSDIFICPNEEPKELKCEKQAIIKIKAAYYGNVWISRCGLGSLRSTCREESSKTLEKLAIDCNGKETCRPHLSLTNTTGNGCNLGNKVLHIEYACEEIALAPGNYIGRIGEIYVDPTCTYKCIFLLSNRALCLPLCPVHYGVACPIGSVIRYRMVPDSFAKHCLCRKPVCLDFEMRCKVNDRTYNRGQRFQLGCEEDCICLGRDELKCVPLCPDRYRSCPEHSKVGFDMQPTRYKECKCPIAKCKAEL